MNDGRTEELTCYECDPKGVNRKVVKVEQREDVKVRHLECGHMSRIFRIIIAEKISVSDSVAASLIINPIPEVEKSLKNQDHFRAVAYLAAILEYYGKLCIDEKFRVENRYVDRDRIDRFTLEQVAIFLYIFKIIDQPYYSALIEINKLRNELLHIRDLAEFRRKSGAEAEATIRRAMECVRILIKHPIQGSI